MSNNDNDSRVDTLCGTCVFAGYEDNKTQTQCAANIIDRIKEQNKSVIYEEINNHTCCKILDFACPFWRPEQWKEHQNIDDVDILVLKARKELIIKADIIIYCDPETSFNDIAKTVKSIDNMDLKPTRIYFVNDHMTKPMDFVRWANDNINMLWRVESIIVDYEDKLRAVDVVSDKCNGMFISVFKAGFEVPVDFLSKIDAALYDNLDRFVCLSPIDDINGLTFMNQLHRTLAGNKYGPILEQVKELCNDQQCQYMMRPITAIVPSMSL